MAEYAELVVAGVGAAATAEADCDGMAAVEKSKWFNAYGEVAEEMIYGEANPLPDRFDCLTIEFLSALSALLRMKLDRIVYDIFFSSTTG